MDTERMVTELVPVVKKLAGRLKLHHGVEREDIESAGMVAVVKAAGEWDESRGVPWVPFATQKAKWAMTDELRSHTKRSDVNTLTRARAGNIEVPRSTDPAKVAEAREMVLSGRVGVVAASLPPPEVVADRVTRLREVMYAAIQEEDVAAMMAAIVGKAKQGHTGAAKLVVDMLAPARGGTKIVQQQAVIINGDDIR